MRPFILISVLVIAPFALIAFVRAITGDAMSAVILGLVIFVTVAAWFAGPSVSTSHTLDRS